MDQELTAEELRVLGCLVEKSFTTPDQYPLTTNSLTNACNQKSSRDPVVDYPSQLVDRTMLSLRDGGWARSIRGVGNRAFKHKHVMDERLEVDEGEQALLAVLALRGPQSAGELCTRTERYAVFPEKREDAFTAVETALAGLAGRETPLVRNVGRESGQSQDRWIQLLDGGSMPGGADHHQPASAQAPDESTLIESGANSGRSNSSPAPPADGSATIDAISARLAALEQRVSDLEELL